MKKEGYKGFHTGNTIRTCHHSFKPASRIVPADSNDRRGIKVNKFVFFCVLCKSHHLLYMKKHAAWRQKTDKAFDKRKGRNKRYLNIYEE